MYALCIVMGKLYQCKKDKNLKWGTFLDIKSAFDTTWNVKVIDKIIVLGVPYYLTSLMRLFLRKEGDKMHIQSRVFVHELTSGAPKSIPSSPTLFMPMLDEVLYLPL